MALEYIALIRKEAGTDYWVNIPDIPGCIASGKTEEEAKAQFAEALSLHLEAMKENGQPLAQPRSREEVLASKEDDYLTDYVVEVEQANQC